jgi:hypothetical protein
MTDGETAPSGASLCPRAKEEKNELTHQQERGRATAGRCMGPLRCPSALDEAAHDAEGVEGATTVRL